MLYVVYKLKGTRSIPVQSLIRSNDPMSVRHVWGQRSDPGQVRYLSKLALAAWLTPLTATVQ